MHSVVLRLWHAPAVPLSWRNRPVSTRLLARMRHCEDRPWQHAWPPKPRGQCFWRRLFQWSACQASVMIGLGHAVQVTRLFRGGPGNVQQNAQAMMMSKMMETMMKQPPGAANPFGGAVFVLVCSR